MDPPTQILTMLVTSYLRPLRHPQIVKMFRKPVITASDEHDVSVMFKDVLEEYMATGKPKGVTSKHLRYTTVKIVNGSLPLTVTVHPTGKRTTRQT